jgi:hypothetical protein
MIERGRSVVGLLSGGKTALFSHGWGTLHIPQLPYALPKLPARPKRKLMRAKAKAHKFTRAQIKKARTNTIRYYRSQYYPATAWTDLRIAALHNEDIVLNSVVILWVIGFACAATLFDFALLFLNTAYDISSLTGIDMKILLLIVGGVLASVGGWVTAFLLNMMSLAILDGANRKIKTTVRSTLRRAISMASTVTTTWLMIALRCAMPLLVTMIVGVVYISYFYGVFTLPLEVWSVAVASMMTWSIVNFLRYSLAPYIVLFERAPIGSALKKSSSMLKHRGKVFLLSIYTCLVAALGIMYVVSYSIDQLIGYDWYLIFAVLAVSGLIATNGVLVMLYRKRKLARK